jgi:1,4-dihydroxy-2-naphthoate octaprenyltransferase
LNINNIRDIASDTKAGKKSIPVRIGKEKAILYNWFLILAGNFSLVVFVLSQQAWWALSALLFFPIMIRVGIGVGRSESIDPYLKQMAIATLFWVVSFGLGLLIFS